MFRSVLVANRGEIACRVFRTAKRMGLRTIAVYSEVDADALHVREADEAVLIGPAPARESYLDQARVLAAAKATGAEAIHPGYGFLSENAEFAEAVMAAGITWIGAPPAAIRAMGLKDAAKSLMVEAGVPVTPGYMGEDQSPDRLKAEADAIGYPVLIKAVAGGGGKGMRRVDAAETFLDALASCQREAASSFGDDRVLIEKYILSPRHIEVQVFGDSHGEVVHLFERDCSLQRRHQKVIEEAPAPGMDAATRQAVTAAAVRAARAVNYVGAGTIEFIADGTEGLRADRIWFMEMNTRLQVEHPVTEMITGQDLVEWQLRVAAGEPLPLKQDQLSITGWAMEARLYAEDPANGFLPSIGRLDHFILPRRAGVDAGAAKPGQGGDREAVEGAATHSVRVDTGVEAGGEVSQFYDPMIAKLIVHEDTREAAGDRLAEACAEVQVWPVRTNAGFLVRCLEHPRFVAGDLDTGFIAAEESRLVAAGGKEADLAAVALFAEHHYEFPYKNGNDWLSPWHDEAGLMGFRMNAPPRSLWALTVGGRKLVAEALSAQSRDSTWLVGPASDRRAVRYRYGDMNTGAVDIGDRALPYARLGDDVVLFDRGNALSVAAPVFGGGSGGSASDGALRAPMPGKIVAAPAKPGDAVTKGQPIVVLEAMKMEHALVAPFDGVVGEIGVSVGDQVAADAVLARVEAASA
jgi:acetyl/propionyl-CoA carboxylase alpha subunit